MKTEAVFQRSEPIRVVPASAGTALRLAANGYVGWQIAVALMKRR